MVPTILHIVVLIISFMVYFLYANALYRLSRRRGLNGSWMAWFPLLQLWTLGNIADHYRRILSNRESFWRWGLLLLAMARDFLLCYGVIKMCALTVIAALYGIFHWMGTESGEISPTFQSDLTIATVYMILGFVLVVLHRLAKVWALYHVYRSCKPKKALTRALLSLIPLVPAFQLHMLYIHDEGMPQETNTEPAIIET